MNELVQILVVDNHPSAAFGVRLMLEKEQDFQVTTVYSGKKALSLLKEKEFDIFIFDLKMPEINGCELAKKTIKLKPEAKIIIYTGYEIKSNINCCGGSWFY